MSLISNTLSGLYPSGLSAGTSTATTTGTWNQLGQISQPTYIGYPSASPIDPPNRKVEIPVINEGQQEGIFLRGKDGKLHYVSADRLAVAAGLEW